MRMRNQLDDLFEHPLDAGGVHFGVILAGTIAAAVSGYFAVVGTLWLLRNCRMRIFALYVWALGAFILCDQLFLHRWFPPLF